MHKFTHVDALYQVAKYIEVTNEDPKCPPEYKITTPVKFRGTVKLHGCNSGVVHHNDQLTAQSRNTALTIEKDHMGFAAFVQDQHKAILELMEGLRARHGIESDKKLVLYGEWIGPGVQNGMAINQVPTKQWVLFAVKTVNVKDVDDTQYLDILGPLGDKYAEQNIYSTYDVGTWELEVDFQSDKSKEQAIVTFEKLTQAVEDKCPWGAKFGIEGLGEGIVWVPVGDHWGNSDLYWKSKGPKHKEVKRAKRNKPSLDPEVLASVEKFIEFAVTDVRLDKGIDYLKEMGHPVEMRSTGQFLKWVGQDVERECRLELQANDLTWKQVGKAVGAKAKIYFAEKVKTF